MTYKQVVEDILSDTPNASAVFAEIANQPIKKPLIQYKETDWEFIKRLASMLNTQLIPDCTTPFPYFSFGQVPQIAEALSADEYVIVSDSRFYEMGSSEVGLYKPNFMCYSVPSSQFYRVGDQTVFLGQTMSVCEQDAVLQDGELLYTYKIGRAGWFSQRKITNKKLIGLCLPGTVAWTDREVLHIDLDIDMGRKPGHYPFSWIPESGNIMYCMPKLGTRAMLYLPSYDTGEAVAITSPRTNGDACGAMSDPQLRCLTTEHGKRMCLFPQNLIFSGGNPGEVLHVEFNDLSCMLMESTRAIQIAAKLQIEIEAPRVTLSTPQEIQACRAPARAHAKVSMIVPKGTGGGNPPTGGRNTFMTMQYQFDLLGEKGILCGTDFKTYDPIPDEPDTKSFSLGSLLLGLAIGVAVAAAVVASVATFGVAATALGALAVASLLCLSGCSNQTELPPPTTDGVDTSPDDLPELGALEEEPLIDPSEPIVEEVEDEVRPVNKRGTILGHTTPSSDGGRTYSIEGTELSDYRYSVIDNIIKPYYNYGVSPDWYMPEGINGTVPSVNIYASDPNITANPITEEDVIATPEGMFVNPEGRYWIAVGPTIMGASFDSNGNVDPSSMKYNTKIDLLVECLLEERMGEQVWLYCVLGDAKVHTFSGQINGQEIDGRGVFQTGFDAHGNWSNNMDASYIEFMGFAGYHSTKDDNNWSVLSGLANWKLVDIVIYD